jgi:HEAT repeat protein
MKHTILLLGAIFLGSASLGQRTSVYAADDADDEVVSMVVSLLGDSDKDMRQLGLQQVREKAKGPEATMKFAALLPKLPSETQIGLLDALADRADVAAAPAVREMLKHQDSLVRLAALRALGPLGNKSDVSLLVHKLAESEAAEQAIVRTSMIRLQGPDINASIVGELKPAKSALRKKLLEVLTARRAIDAIPAISALAVEEDAETRMASMVSLGQMAGPENVATMLQGVLAASKGAERDAAEKSVMTVCNRTKDPNQRAEPILTAWANRSESDRTALLPTLGRVGGNGALVIVETAIGAENPERREAGLRAICNWPDASVCARLLQLAEQEKEPRHRDMALHALIRVAALPDNRSNAEKLDLLKKAMSMTTSVAERNYLLTRCQAIRTIESLRFVAPYMDQPEYAEKACATVVDLARHRELRAPNKAEFDRSLDAVIRISKDPALIDRAQRYKKGQT